MQLRNQKVVEVAPARGIHPKLRERLTKAGIQLALDSGYRGVGTVEFLVKGPLSDPDAKVAFLEVNPRVQVEHTITEQVTGVDIVQAQLLVASGFSLAELGLASAGAAVPRLRGYSIQARINMSGGGTLKGYTEPAGEGVRMEALGYQGYTVSTNFDPLLAKVICSHADWEACRALTLASLEGFAIEGVGTNKAVVVNILRHPLFERNEVLTNFMLRHA